MVNDDKEEDGKFVKYVKVRVKGQIVRERGREKEDIAIKLSLNSSYHSKLFNELSELSNPPNVNSELLYVTT